MSVDKLVDSTQLDTDLTSVANAIRTKGGTSASLAFPAGFVSAIAAIPTGGGSGFTTIASGTFIGSNNSQDAGRQLIPIGNKMAQTDFFVLVNAKNGEEYPYNDKYKWVWLYAECRKMFGYWDLSSDGWRSFIASTGYHIDLNNSGTITTVNPGRMIKLGVNLRNSGLNEINYNTFSLCRNINQIAGFQIHLGHSNTLYPFIPITFEYEVVYFGNDPTNDIIDLS